ncbi:MAG: hypothetical protein PHW52_03510 [Candidatus Pacebacteria bacterium]|nr:hypothetical protein [Candidatus Paceibacterota bacterium]
MAFAGRVASTLVPFGIFGRFEIVCDYEFDPDIEPDEYVRLSAHAQKFVYYDEEQHDAVKRQYSSWLLRRASGYSGKLYRYRGKTNYGKKRSWQ